MSEALTLKVSGGSITVEGDRFTSALCSEGLKQECPDCGREGCYEGCERSIDIRYTKESVEERHAREVSDRAIDGMESLVLALHQTGLYDVSKREFVESMEVALDAIGNNQG